MRGGVSLQCCGEQARPGGGAGGGRNAAAWNPASFPNAPAHGGVYSACSCNCRTCMRHATSGEEQTPGAAACVKRLLQRSAWHAPAPGPRRCARRPRQAPRAAPPDPCPRGARQAFTPEFRRGHPALTRYLQTLYGHPAALRALRRPLPAPEAELVPGEAALRASDSLPVQNPTRAQWSGAHRDAYPNPNFTLTLSRRSKACACRLPS